MLGNETVVDLSAQHIYGGSYEEDGVLAFWIGDETTGISVSHEMGDPETAAKALDELAGELRKHAATLRARDQLRRGLHGPLTGPVPWPR